MTIINFTDVLPKVLKILTDHRRDVYISNKYVTQLYIKVILDHLNVEKLKGIRN